MPISQYIGTQMEQDIIMYLTCNPAKEMDDRYQTSVDTIVSYYTWYDEHESVVQFLN